MVNFVCIVFEQGDKMLTLWSMEKPNSEVQPKGNLTKFTLSWPFAFNFENY